MATPWQVSFKSDAVISLSSLCLIEGNPPLGQERACCTEKEWPQTQFVGICNGGQPYQRAMASRNAVLWSANPYSSSGKAVSQLEAPFSLARSVANCIGGVRDLTTAHSNNGRG